MSLSIEVVSDVVCPWCFIGKRRLDEALHAYRALGKPAPSVLWRPYQLNPGLPEAGADGQQFFAGQFGEVGRNRVYARVAAIGKQIGIQFAFEKIVRQPNTLAAHSLIGLADGYGLQSRIVDIPGSRRT